MSAGQGLLYSLYERRLLKEIESGALPQHIGVILDGHRRFARAEGLEDYQQSYARGMRCFEEFLEWFATEDACLQYIRLVRWPDGFCCPHCGSHKYWEMKRV